jgi:NADH-quinone oxidoreductase subunit B
VQGVDRFMPVDVYVPGCPPRPEQLIQSVIDLQDLVRKTGTLMGSEFAKRTVHNGPQVNEAIPDGVVVAPGDYEKSKRISLN